MRICDACGRENPDEADFCQCGEYLRWEPTGAAPALERSSSPSGNVAPRSSGAGQPPAAAPEPSGPPAVPTPPSAAGGAFEQAEQVAVTLRRADEEGASAGGAIALDVQPGEEAVLIARVRNQSGV